MQGIFVYVHLVNIPYMDRLGVFSRSEFDSRMLRVEDVDSIEARTGVHKRNGSDF